MGKTGANEVELSLLGNCSLETKNYFLNLIKKNRLNSQQVKFLPAVEESKIAAIASIHHIGLACEVPYILNREICLTNKVFMYPLGANAIVFTKTKAQLLFLEQHPGIGVMYEPGDVGQLVKLLNNYINHPELLHQHRIAALKVATEQLNWETEKEILLRKINELLN